MQFAPNPHMHPSQKQCCKVSVKARIIGMDEAICCLINKVRSKQGAAFGNADDGQARAGVFIVDNAGMFHDFAASACYSMSVRV